MSVRHAGAMCTVPGGRIWYEMLNPDAPGTPVVVVHGGPGTPHDYLRSLAELLPGHPVLVYDQLGCGRSERPTGPDLWRLPRFVDELEALLAEVGLGEFHLLAHSFGTMIACDLVLRGRFRPQTVAMVSPVLSVRRYEQDMQQLLLRLPPHIARALVAAARGGPANGFETAEATMFFAERHLCRCDPWPEVLLDVSVATNAEVRDTLWGPTEFQVSGNLRTYCRLDRLPELDIPTLLMCGEHDFTPPATCRSYSRLLPDARVVIISGASHMPHLEAPEECGARLRDFFDTATSTTRSP